MSRWELGLLIMAAALLGSLLAGCASNDAPAEAAKEWFVAVNTMDSLEADALVCDGMKDQFRSDMATGAILKTLGNILLGGSLDIDLDVSDVKFTTTQRRDDQAIVDASGEFRASVGGQVVSQPVAESWVMVREGAQWRWCGDLGSMAEGVAPQPPDDAADAVATLETSAGASAPIGVQPTPLAPEQVAAQTALWQVMNSRGYPREAIRDVRYETISKDESAAQIAVTFAVWDDSRRAWLEDTNITFQARFMAGKWNIDVENYSFALSSGAVATIAVIEEGTRVAVEQATALAGENYNRRLGGTAVYLLSPYFPVDPLSFGVTSQDGRNSIIRPVVPANSPYEDRVTSIALSPSGDELYVALVDGDVSSMVFSLDLAGEQIQTLASWTRQTDPYLWDVEQMLVSPDGNRIAIVSGGHDGQVWRSAAWILDPRSGDLEPLWHKEGFQIGPVAWSHESSALFTVLSNFGCWEDWGKGRYSCDGPAVSLNKITLDGAREVTVIRDLSHLQKYPLMPDGGSIAITPDGRDAILNISGIIVVSMQDDSQFVLRDVEDLCHLSLSLDGSKLVYTQARDYVYYVYALDMQSGDLYHPDSLPEIRIGVYGGGCTHRAFAWVDN